MLALGLIFANYNIWLALFAGVTAVALWVLPRLAPWLFAAGDVALIASGRFKATTEYESAAAYEKGGEKHFFTLLHKPHYLILVVQPLQPVPTGSTAKAKPDTTKPTVAVVMVRDLGSLRQPAFVITLFSGGLFLVFCFALHLRDKAIMAARTASTAPAAT